MEMISIAKELKENSYPGREILWPVGRWNKSGDSLFYYGQKFQQP